MPIVQYPASVTQVRVLPTLTNFIVTKFDDSQKYREEEEVENELGQLYVINGLDFSYYYDIEMIVKVGGTIPTPLTKLTFTAPTLTNAIPILGTATGMIDVIIRGEVKLMGKAGGMSKIGFKGFQNAVDT